MALAIPAPLTAALAYAARGWPVFPVHSMRAGKCSCGKADCSNPGKHPRTPRGRDDASVDPRAISSWWSRWDDANVGIATGALPGGGFLVVLDVDPRHGGDEALGELERRFGRLPETGRVVTGGGGQHIYFVGDDVPSSAGRVGEGLDVRARGGYVLAPPSNHESGRPYLEDAGAPLETSLAVLPDWLKVLAAKPERPSLAPANGASAFIEGNRNSALMSLAGTMRKRDFGVSAIFAALSIQNREKCRPPLDELEVRRIAQGVGRYAPSDPANGTDPWNIMSVEQIFAPLPPYPWLIHGLHVAPGRITLLNGYADVGKTVIAQSVALAVAAGRPVWGLFAPAASGVVLHLNGELGSYIARERYQRLARGMGIDVAALLEARTLRLSNYPSARLDDEDFEAKLVEVCQGVKLVIVDSLRAFSGGLNENDKEIGVALLMLARVSEQTGATIIVLHHNRKPTKDDVGGAKMAISGSSSILGGAECAFVMNAEKGGPITVQHERSPIGRPLQDFGLRIEDVERDGDPRWGLRVVHYDAAQITKLQEDAKAAEGRAEAVKVAEAIAETLSRYAGVFRGSKKTFRETCGLKVRHERFVAVLGELVASGQIIEGGTYHQPEFRVGSIEGVNR